MDIIGWCYIAATTQLSEIHYAEGQFGRYCQSAIRAVKQTDRLRRRRFCSPLRRWFRRAVFALLACRLSPFPLELLGVADPLDIP